MRAVMPGLQGKVALITGAAGGMGGSHALELAQEGVNLVLTDVLEAKEVKENVERIKAGAEKFGARVIVVHCDVTKEADVEDAVSRGLEAFGKIDILIANAGIMRFGWSWELSEADVKQVIDVDLIGVWRCDKAVLPHMIERKSGTIINVSSTAGLKSTPNMAHYCMAKFGVIGLTKTIAKEVAKYGILVNAVCPTVTQTQMTNNPSFFEHVSRMSGKKVQSAEQAAAILRESHPLKQGYVTPRDVSRKIVWLCSDEAKYITGSTIAVDAGSLL
jgi:NAD(P)-dependent dehydrogenase (short-subunit alcohol dehydrogenase family)